MTLVQARALARMLMKRHGVGDWRFMFDRARRRFGCCRYRRKLITLSAPLTLLNDERQVRQTVLHEIAHALTPGDGHGRRWRKACIELGIRPEARYDEAEVLAPPRAAARYQFGCRACGWWVSRRRLSVTRYVCARCRGGLCYRETATGRHFVAARGAGNRIVRRFES